MRSTWGATLAVLLLFGCPEQLGDRCGDQLPPCPAGFSCVEARCTAQAGGQSGGATAGGQSGGMTAGGGAAAGGQSGGATAGGQSGGPTAGGQSGGPTAGGQSGGATAGGQSGGATAGGQSGGATAGGQSGGATAGGQSGGATAGGQSGGATAGGQSGGATAGGQSGGATAGGQSGGATAGGQSGGATAGGQSGGTVVLVVRDFEEHVQLDGSVLGFPRSGEIINLVEFLPDGGVQRTPMLTDGGGIFSLGSTSGGVRLFEAIRPALPPVLAQSSLSQVDLSTLYSSGRPGDGLVGQSASFLLTLLPWQFNDYIQGVSLSAGSNFDVRPTGQIGSSSYSGTAPISMSSGPAISQNDDLRISQFRSQITDAGFLVSLAGVAFGQGFAVPGDTIAMSLTQPPLTGSIVIPAGTFSIASKLGGAPEFCNVDVSERVGGRIVRNSPLLMTGRVDPSTTSLLPVPRMTVS